MHSPLAALKKFVADLLLWSLFAGGLAASAGAGVVLDGTRKDVATVVGTVVALIAGSRIAKKPRIKAFLSRPGTLWFLFLFNGGAAAAMYVTMDGVKGIIGAAMMGLVSLGAAGGLVSGRRKKEEAAGAAPAAEAGAVVSGRV
ncbi:hypothetical protein [Streptomyces justiciae]|uniref:Integral membrane protein n=1 Tax=Streptomyces justiciae TaxID=2780140 RepID=A0ABU3LJK4_9ACTN|nr:hypothetical protein [Streptomyces justiciae]MDT7839416.1 hypothetical protein [Streptomyces justiciae]